MDAINRAQFIDPLNYPTLERTWNVFNEKNTWAQTAWKVALIITTVFFILGTYDLIQRKWKDLRSIKVVLPDPEQVKAAIRELFQAKLESLPPRAPRRNICCRMNVFTEIVQEHHFNSNEEFRIFTESLLQVILEDVFQKDVRRRETIAAFGRIIHPELFNQYMLLPQNPNLSLLNQVNSFGPFLHEIIKSFVFDDEARFVFKQINDCRTERLNQYFEREVEWINRCFTEANSFNELTPYLARFYNILERTQTDLEPESLIRLQEKFIENIIHFFDKDLPTERVLNQYRILNLRPHTIDCLQTLRVMKQFFNQQRYTLDEFIAFLSQINGFFLENSQFLVGHPLTRILIGHMRMSFAAIIPQVYDKIPGGINFGAESGARKQELINQYLSEKIGIPHYLGLSTIPFEVPMDDRYDEELAEVVAQEWNAENCEEEDRAAALALFYQLSS